jgi:hypothetical protein
VDSDVTSDGYWRIVKREGLSGAARNTANRVGLFGADSEAGHGWIRTSYGLKRSGQAGPARQAERQAKRVVVGGALGGGGDVFDSMLFLAVAFAVAGVIVAVVVAAAAVVHAYAVAVPVVIDAIVGGTATAAVADA